MIFSFLKKSFFKWKFGHFPGGPVVGNQGDMGLILDWVTGIPHAVEQLESLCAVTQAPHDERETLCPTAKTWCSQIDR